MSASPEIKPNSPAAEVEEPAQAPTPGAGDEQEQENTAAGSPAAAESEVEDKDNESDDESILSEVDEAQFEDFDPENVDVEDRPQLAIDEDNLKLIGRHKRMRTEDGQRSTRKREGRREKKSRRMRDLEEAGSDEEGKSKKRGSRKRKEPTPEDDETLDPATRMSRSFFLSGFVVGDVG
jgi:transcription factor SPN1